MTRATSSTPVRAAVEDLCRSWEAELAASRTEMEASKSGDPGDYVWHSARAVTLECCVAELRAAIQRAEHRRQIANERAEFAKVIKGLNRKMDKLRP